MSELEEQKAHQWRLSDFLCTYRFWVITNFLISIYSIKFIFFSGIPFLKNSNNLSDQSIGTLFAIMSFGTTSGTIIAWLISRSKSIYSLAILSIISIICLYLTTISQDLVVWGGSFFVLYMLSATAMFLAIAYIAQAAKTPLTFIVLFGCIYALMNTLPFSIRFNSQGLDYHYIAQGIIFSIVIATILLLFVHKKIFYSLPTRATLNHLDNNSVTTTWTWADLVSSYRFWGLACFFICATMGQYYMRSYLPIYSINILGSSFSIMPIFEYTSIIAGFMAILIALAAYSLHTYWSLFVLCLLMIFAIILSNTVINLPMLVFSVFLYQCMYYALFLIILASIAKAIDSVPGFVAIFSIFMLGNFFNSMTSPALVISIMSTFPNKILHIQPNIMVSAILIFFAIISLIFLAPVNTKLFNQPAKIRHIVASPHVPCSAIGTFLLFCIPFYAFFWLARVHNNIRHYSQSPQLLTPTGAVLSTLFVPFSWMFIFSILYDITNKEIKNCEKAGWGFILLSLILPQLAAAIIQSRLNTLYYKNSHTTSQLSE